MTADILKKHIQSVMSLWLQLSMEAGEENSGNVKLKRQRGPLSDSGDNVPSPSGLFVPVLTRKSSFTSFRNTESPHF